VHDAVDVVAVERESQEEPVKYITMTTRHAKESLKKVAWYFKELAIPSEEDVFGIDSP